VFSLKALTILLTTAVVAVVIFKRFGLGSVLAYLAAGVALGPAALAVVDDVEQVFHFSEFGVVLLLFIIGLELQPSRLWVMRRQVFGLGGAQVLLTGAALAGAALALGVAPAAAAVVGLGLALSSTAFVMPLLAARGEGGTPQGRAAFAVLILQDLAIIPLMALVAALGVEGAAPAGGHSAAEVELPMLLTAGRALGVIIGLFLAGRYLLRPAFRAAARTGYREVFTALALLVVLGTGALMELIGLSMSLGAFVAGVLLADSEYRHAVQAVIEPFKDLLLGLFFMAIGMSINVQSVVDAPLTILGLTVGFMVIKSVSIFGAARLFRLPEHTARATAASLSQGGEFAFVLFGAAAQLGVVPAAVGDPLMVVVGVSMVLTPGLVALNDWWDARRLAAGPARPFDTVEDGAHKVIIAGFGRVGQIVARILTSRGIAFTALESNPTSVDFVRKFGNKIHYGDASQEDLLRAAHAGHAEVLVVAIDDVAVSVRTVEMVKHAFPHLRIYARARNRQHALTLMSLGVASVVRETFDGSLRLAEDVLQGMGFDAEKARDTSTRFAVHDEGVLQRQLAFKDDQSKLIQTSQEAAAELESLFSDDGAQGPVV
jgi:glutathione-regulated potassium-efflux system ancillary protein KefC/glutathione-regulated potassium-efflux system protein KefB